MSLDMEEHLKCFISYSWDSEEHKDWVRHFGEILQKNGVYVYLDQWDTRPGMDLPQYMEESIRECDFVILICTPKFSEKANKGTGGVGYEKSIVTGELFTDISKQTKFIPIIRVGSPSESLPSYLKPKLFVDFTDDTQFQSCIEQVLRHLHNEPAVSRPKLGPKPLFHKENISAAGNISTTNDPSEIYVALPSQKPANDRGFNIERFKKLKAFAYGSDGFNMSLSSAKAWATEHLEDSPPFNIEHFKKLKAFAYSSDGFNMSLSSAKTWAISKLQET
jgi:hypothetical protein